MANFCTHDRKVYQPGKDQDFNGKPHYVYHCPDCGVHILSRTAPGTECSHTNYEFKCCEMRRGTCGRVRPHEVWWCPDCTKEWASVTHKAIRTLAEK